jgi:hypothetical protein
VGNNGETLVADSSTSTGLRYQANFAAGKNKVINGAFNVWQRGTSFNPAALGYFFAADRFISYTYSASATTISRQTFTPGTAPVAGYEGNYFLRGGSTNTQFFMESRLEDVTTYAGQTVTFSLWAKAAAAHTTGNFYIAQNFGSGGSTAVDTILGTAALTTSWQRFSFTVTLPSISGKTIGTGSYIAVAMQDVINNTTDTWGWQLEAGSVATAFQTATGTIQGELAACQRYYERLTAAMVYEHFGVAQPSNSTTALATVYFKVSKRSAVSSTVDYSTLGLYDTAAIQAISSLSMSFAGINSATVSCVSTGLTTQRFYQIMANNSTSAYIGFSAEL